MENVVFLHPYQGNVRFGSATWALNLLHDGPKVGSGAVLKSRANLEPLGSRFGTV